jgi:hypothetical protein
VAIDERIQIFHESHRSRGRENAFGRFLADCLGAVLVDKHFEVPHKALETPINTRELLDWLRTDRRLPPKKRQECIDLTSGLPRWIRIAIGSWQASFDFVVQQGDRCYCWEFHEVQHRNLAVDRPAYVYGQNGRALRVPRFLQRLIRDVWRLKTFPDLTIVWVDWFDAEKDCYKPVLAPGFREYHLPTQFSFREFCRLTPLRQLQDHKKPCLREAVIAGPQVSTVEADRKLDYSQVGVTSGRGASAVLKTKGDYTTQRITTADIRRGQIRIPSRRSSLTTGLFPASRSTIDVRVRGHLLKGAWDPRTGLDRQRSGVLRLGTVLSELVGEDDILVACEKEGVIELN